MAAPGILYRIREWLTGFAFAVYLLCAGMTKEEFWAEQDRQALQQILEANGVGELVEAAEKVYQLRDAMHADGPSALIIALAMIDLHKAAEHVRQGSASKPPNAGN
jgi:hypothetical protein